MMLRHHWQIGGGGVGAGLLFVFAAGDDGGDGLMLEAPGEGPLGHFYAGGDFAAGDFLNFVEALFDGGPVLAGANVVGGELDAWLVFSAQESAGEGDAGEDAEVLGLTAIEHGLFGGAIEAVVDDLDGFDFSAGGGFYLVDIFLGQAGD